jgi:hypothetical protein
VIAQNTEGWQIISTRGRLTYLSLDFVSRKQPSHSNISFPERSLPLSTYSPQSHRKLFLRGAKEEQSFGDFRDDLQRDGFAVVKGAVPRERADKYAEEMFQWLEDL